MCCFDYCFTAAAVHQQSNTVSRSKILNRIGVCRNDISSFTHIHASTTCELPRLVVLHIASPWTFQKGREEVLCETFTTSLRVFLLCGFPQTFSKKMTIVWFVFFSELKIIQLSCIGSKTPTRKTF